MGKQRIKVGGREIELETLTKDELETSLEQVLSGYLRPPSYVRPEGGGNLSGAGAGIFDLYPVQAGMMLRLTRLYVTVGTTTFAATLSGTFGISVYRGSGSVNDEIDGLGPVTSLPQVGTWSRSNAPTVRDGEILRVGIVGGPANGQFFARGAGFYETLASEDDLPYGGDSN